jgi:hypothetical protein
MHLGQSGLHRTETIRLASRASDESDLEDLNKYLSGNFTRCVQSYTACTAGASLASEMSDCVKRFHSCSLQLLKEANIEDKRVEGAILEPESGKDKKLSSSLFSCIRGYVMCLMRKDQWCMRDYNKCTLDVLDNDLKSKQNQTLVEETDIDLNQNQTLLETTEMKSKQNESLIETTDLETKNDLQGSQNQTLEEEGPGREGSTDLETSDNASTPLPNETSSATNSETSFSATEQSVTESTSSSVSNQRNVTTEIDTIGKCK